MLFLRRRSLTEGSDILLSKLVLVLRIKSDRASPDFGGRNSKEEAGSYESERRLSHIL